MTETNNDATPPPADTEMKVEAETPVREAEAKISEIPGSDNSGTTKADIEAKTPEASKETEAGKEASNAKSGDDAPNHRPEGPARAHHSKFVHVALPNLLLSKTSTVTSLIKGRHGRDFMNDIWARLAREFGAKALPSKGLSYSNTILGNGTPVALIKMPPPERLGEAFFAAVVMQETTKWFFLKTTTVRYFTLDMALGGCVLREFTRQAGEVLKNVELEKNVKPDKKAFLRSVKHIVQGKQDDDEAETSKDEVCQEV